MLETRKVYLDTGLCINVGSRRKLSPEIPQKEEKLRTVMSNVKTKITAIGSRIRHSNPGWGKPITW